MSDNYERVYVAEYYSEYSEEWIALTTKAGNRYHSTHTNAKRKASSMANYKTRVNTYVLKLEETEVVNE